MDIERAEKIFKAWQAFMEIADKFSRLMLPMPKSFLPYPYDEIEEALNTMAKSYFDSGDKETANMIQETISGYLWRCENDNEALEKMRDSLDVATGNIDLKEALLDGLKKSTDSWLKIRERAKN